MYKPVLTCGVCALSFFVSVDFRVLNFATSIIFDFFTGRFFVVVSSSVVGLRRRFLFFSKREGFLNTFPTETSFSPRISDVVVVVVVVSSSSSSSSSSSGEKRSAPSFHRFAFVVKVLLFSSAATASFSSFFRFHLP